MGSGRFVGGYAGTRGAIKTPGGGGRVQNKSFMAGGHSGWLGPILGPGGTLTPPTLDGFLWLRADGGAGQFTKDGSNRVSLWINQFPPPLDAAAVNVFGVPLALSQYPVWTPSIQNGLPAMAWSEAAGTQLNKLYPAGTFNQPTNDGEPLLIAAVFKCGVGIPALNWGDLLTMRLNNDDCEFTVRKYFPTNRQLAITTAQDAFGYVFLGPPPIVDYTNQTILVTWEYYGSTVGGLHTIPQVYVNGINLPMDPTYGPVHDYTGLVGYSVGYCNADASHYFDGYIMEILGYRGANEAHALATFPTTRAAAIAYLNQKWHVF